MYKIKINPLALRDLQEIRAYLMEKELNSDLAIKVLRQIVGRYEQLRDYPLMGMSLSDLTGIRTSYRYLVSGSYLIFYRVEGKAVFVCRILYSRRDYLKILTG